MQKFFVHNENWQVYLGVCKDNSAEHAYQVQLRRPPNSAGIVVNQMYIPTSDQLRFVGWSVPANLKIPLFELLVGQLNFSSVTTIWMNIYAIRHHTEEAEPLSNKPVDRLMSVDVSDNKEHLIELRVVERPLENDPSLYRQLRVKDGGSDDPVFYLYMWSPETHRWVRDHTNENDDEYIRILKKHQYLPKMQPYMSAYITLRKVSTEFLDRKETT